jgi:hypothetical protein
MRISTAWRPEIPHLVILLSALMLVGAASLSRAQTTEPGTGSPAGSSENDGATTLKGKHARRAARVGQWIEQLKQDRRRIYDQYGYPTYRFYELEFDARTEHWFYLAENREFVFAGDRLVGQQ